MVPDAPAPWQQSPLVRVQVQLCVLGLPLACTVLRVILDVVLLSTWRCAAWLAALGAECTPPSTPRKVLAIDLSHNRLDDAAVLRVMHAAVAAAPPGCALRITLTGNPLALAQPRVRRRGRRRRRRRGPAPAEDDAAGSGEVIENVAIAWDTARWSVVRWGAALRKERPLHVVPVWRPEAGQEEAAEEAGALLHLVRDVLRSPLCQKYLLHW